MARNGAGPGRGRPYGSGILAKGPQAYPRYAYQDAPRRCDRVRRMDEICRRHGVPRRCRLCSSPRDPRVVSTIVGMSRPERIAQTLELARLPIPDALWPELDGVGYSTDDPRGRALK